LARIGEADRLGREQSIPVLFKTLVPTFEGLAMLRSGQLRAAISSLRAGIDGWTATGGNLNVPYVKGALAEALASAGDLDTGLRLLDECLEQIDRPGWHERVWLAELLRLKGWVLMRQGKPVESEAQLRASIEWAQRQHAKSWELRSSTTLAELLIDGNRRSEAYDLLFPIHQWFKEGFDTRDLRAAQSVLATLP
jgi:predicted ATPase